MKTIGLIGGMSYESSITYYDLINKGINEKLGGLNSAQILLSSLNFSYIEKLQRQNDWDKAADVLTKHAKILADGGADFILICTNTMHKVYEKVQNSINIPILHIAKCTLNELNANNIKNIGLIGTRYTMCENFYKDVLKNGGINVIIPSNDDINFINNAIFNELCMGNINSSTRNKFLDIANNLNKNGAQGVILGCTEIGMLLNQKNTNIKLFDTTLIHIKEAVNLALS